MFLFVEACLSCISFRSWMDCETSSSPSVGRACRMSASGPGGAGGSGGWSSGSTGFCTKLNAKSSEPSICASASARLASASSSSSSSISNLGRGLWFAKRSGATARLGRWCGSGSVRRAFSSYLSSSRM